MRRILARPLPAVGPSTITDAGALARIEEMIADYVREADRALSGARLGNAAVSELRD